jgi:hypothetical protein
MSRADTGSGGGQIYRRGHKDGGGVEQGNTEMSSLNMGTSCRGQDIDKIYMDKNPGFQAEIL